MKNEQGVIFDLDGTLYRLRSSDGTFGNSSFYADLQANMSRFLADRLGLSSTDAECEYTRIKDQYNGEVSLGVELELGIDRYEWFGNTWNLDPARYVDAPGENLAESLAPFRGRSLVLTAAPAAWAYRVLEYLGMDEMFDGKVITGEPDLRKPNPAIFRKAAQILQKQCCEVISVGDQNESDIVPAKALGMTTVRIGSVMEDADYRVDDVYGAVNLLARLSLRQK